MSTVDAPFVAAYELELDVDLPGVGVGPLQLFYPGATEAGGSSDLLVRVTPLGGEAWLAVEFARLRREHELRVLAVAADGSSAMPGVCRLSKSCCKMCDTPFAHFTGIAAYGTGSLVWQADFVLDGLKILSRTGTELWIRGDHYATGEEQLVINVMTGEIVQRPCGHRRWTDFTKPHPGRICSVCGVKRMNPR